MDMHMPTVRRGWMAWGGAAWALVAGVLWAQPAGHTAPVVVSRVVRRTVREPVWLIGTSEAPMQSTVASEVEGRVESFPVHEGQMVQRGDTLAALSTTTRKNLLAAARARLTQCESECEELRRGHRPEEVEQAKARLTESEAQLTLAKKSLDRARKLAARRAASEQSLDDAQALHNVAVERVHVMRSAYALARQGERQEKRDQAEARRLAAAANVKHLEDLILMATIRAPFAGQVVAERTQIGEWVSKGGAVAEIIQLDPVHVNVPVMERYVSNIRTGDAVQVRFSALGKTTHAGTVVRILARGDSDAHTFPVKVALPNPDWRIKSGMFARVRFDIGGARSAVLVPKDAVVRSRGMTLLFTLSPTNEVTPLPVQLGERFASMVEVGPPAKPGMKVIVRGNERLRPKQKVTVTGELSPDRYLDASATSQPTPTTQRQAPRR